jgi:hypothetical protein
MLLTRFSHFCGSRVLTKTNSRKAPPATLSKAITNVDLAKWSPSSV